MNCKNELKIGDVVKSLDFVGTNDCYFIGRVTRINSDRGEFCAKIIARIWEGKSVYFAGETFVSPLQGQLLSDRLGTRVEVIA
jgi:hypothetical protein